MRFQHRSFCCFSFLKSCGGQKLNTVPIGHDEVRSSMTFPECKRCDADGVSMELVFALNGLVEMKYVPKDPIKPLQLQLLQFFLGGYILL